MARRKRIEIKTDTINTINDITFKITIEKNSFRAIIFKDESAMCISDIFERDEKFIFKELDELYGIFAKFSK